MPIGKLIHDLILVIDGNLGHVLNRFGDNGDFKTENRLLSTSSYLTPSLGLNLFEFLDDLSGKNYDPGRSISEDFMILACVILTQYQRVTDRRADRPDMPTIYR